MTRRLTQQPEAKKLVGASDTDTARHLAQEFSDIELLVAIDVISSAVTDSKKHVDLGALRSVLAKLTAAYDSKRGGAR